MADHPAPLNLLAELPTHAPEEEVLPLVAAEHLRLERIVSTGHSSPPTSGTISRSMSGSPFCRAGVLSNTRTALQWNCSSVILSSFPPACGTG